MRRNIFVRQDPDRDDVTSAGIHILTGKLMIESQKQLGRRGTVAAVGPDVDELKVGDRVLYGEFLHPHYFEDGVRYIRLSDQDIVGVIE